MEHITYDQLLFLAEIREHANKREQNKNKKILANCKFKRDAVHSIHPSLQVSLHYPYSFFMLFESHVSDYSWRFQKQHRKNGFVIDPLPELLNRKKTLFDILYRLSKRCSWHAYPKFHWETRKVKTGKWIMIHILCCINFMQQNHLCWIKHDQITVCNWMK